MRFLYPLQDARGLATKVVANYALTEMGITPFAPRSGGPGFMRKSFEVAVDNIDADLFGRSSRGGSFQPSDKQTEAVARRANQLLLEAYSDAKVSASMTSC